MGPLHVAQVAGVLHDDGAERRSTTEAVEAPGAATRGRRPPGPRTRAAVGGPEEVAVVLERRAAPRRVDDDRCVAGHRRHHRARPVGGRPAPSPAWLCSAPQQSRRADTERGADGLMTARRRPVRVALQASITQPVNSHTASVAGVGPMADPRPRRSGEAGQHRLASGRGAAAGRRPAASSRRATPDAGRAHANAGPQPARGREVIVGERFAGAFHQAAERHAARARRLAPAALDARLHEPHEVAVGGLRRATARPASRRCGHAATTPPRPSPGTSGSAAGTGRTPRMTTVPRRRGAGRGASRHPTVRAHCGRHCRSIGLAAPVTPAAAGLRPRGRVGDDRRSTRISVAATRRSSAIASAVGSPAQRPAVPAGERRRTSAPASPTAAPHVIIAWSHPRGAAHSRSQSSSTGTVGRHHDVAGVHVAVAHHPRRRRIEPAAMTIDRRDEADERCLVELVADLGEQPIEVPPRERLGSGSGYAGRQSSAAPVRGRRPPSARRPPSHGCRVDDHQALPRRRGELAVDERIGPSRCGHPHAVARRGARPARSPTPDQRCTRARPG